MYTNFHTFLFMFMCSKLGEEAATAAAMQEEEEAEGGGEDESR